MAEHIVTTEMLYQFDPHQVGSGRITITLHEPQSTSEHLTFVDIKVGGYVLPGLPGHLRLERVDADKLIHVLQQLQVEAGRPVTNHHSR